MLGAVNPIKDICALAHAAGARVVVDGAQAVPHVKIDVRDLGCDFYIFSGHKMLGPMATGVLWGRRELLDSMPRITSAATWRTLSSSTAQNSSTARRNSRRELPTWQGLLVLPRPSASSRRRGTTPGLVMIRRWFNTASHDWQVFQRLRLIGPRRAENRVPVFTFVLEGRAPPDVARALDDQGIAVRAGDMAAMPLLKRFGASEAIRASAYVYSTLQDIDRLADALQGIVK